MTTWHLKWAYSPGTTVWFIIVFWILGGPQVSTEKPENWYKHDIGRSSLYSRHTKKNMYLFKSLILDFYILRRKYLTHFPISFLSRAGQSGARVGEAIGASQPYLLQNHLSEISDILVSPILPKFPSPEILKSVLLSLVWKFTCSGFSVIFFIQGKGWNIHKTKWPSSPAKMCLRTQPSVWVWQTCFKNCSCCFLLHWIPVKWDICGQIQQ